jgi:hypothetical protein
MTVWVKVAGSSRAARWHILTPSGFNCPQVPDYSRPKARAMKRIKPHRACRVCRGALS